MQINVGEKKKKMQLSCISGVIVLVCRLQAMQPEQTGKRRMIVTWLVALGLWRKPENE